MALGGGGNVLGLVFKIKADGTEKTKADIRELRSEFNKEVNDIKNSGTSSFLSLGQSAGFSTQQLAGLATGAFAVAGAIATIVAAGTAAVTTLLALAKSASDYGSKLWDAHLKTSVSVETLSALQQAGKQADITLEQISNGLVRFTNNLGLADAGSKKHIAIFEQLGVKTYKDTDKALQEFIVRFGTLRTDQERTLAASQAFGTRMGAIFAVLFEQVGYDIEAFKDKLRSLGMLTSTEQAKAADEFGDLYVQVTEQLNALVRQIGFQVMPQIQRALQDASTWLGENQVTIDQWTNTLEKSIGLLWDWGGTIVAVAKSILPPLGVVLDTLQLINAAVNWASPRTPDTKVRMGQGDDAETVDVPAGVDPALAATWAAQQKATKPAKKPGEHDFKVPTGGGGGRQKKDNTAKQALDAELAALRDQMSARDSLYREETSKLRAEYDQRLTDFNSYIAAQRKANDDRLNDTIDKINAEIQAIDTAHAKRVISENEYKKQSAEIDKQTEAAKARARAEEARLDTEEYKHKVAMEQRLYQERKALRDRKTSDQIADYERMRELEMENAEWMIVNLRELVAKKLAIELEYNEKIKTARLQQLQREQDRLYEEVRAIAEHYAEIKKVSIAEAMQSKVVQDALAERAERIRAIEYERSRVIKQTSDANIKAYRDEARAAFEAQNAAAAGATRPRRVNDPNAKVNQLEELQKKLKELYGMKGEAFFDAMMVGLNGIADAAGNAVRSFVLFGDSGTSFRKFAAEVLASIAQMAIVKAIWELAEGFAALARAFFGDPRAAAEAKMHFTAAAIYGALGGVAAIAGRVVAGDSFKNQGAGGGSGETGASSGTGTGSRNDQNRGLPDINIGRFQSIPVALKVDVNVKRDAGSIVDVVVRDYQNNGRTRQVTQKDGQTAR